MKIANYLQTKTSGRAGKRAGKILTPSKLRDRIKESKGKCAFSGAQMTFKAEDGTPRAGKPCHPLYASVDHTSPRNSAYGYQLVCYALNDLKGSLPNKLFSELKNTPAWNHLMQQWKSQAENNSNDREAFKTLLKD